MPVPNGPPRIEYICTYCGRRMIRSKMFGRPDPGGCPRKPRLPDGKMRPHTWTISRQIP